MNTDLVQSVLTYLNNLYATIAHLPLDKWASVLVGPVLFYGTPLIRLAFPKFRGGKFLFAADLRKKVSFWKYWSWRSLNVLIPVLSGFAILPLPGFGAALPLFLGGAFCFFAYLVQRRKTRSEAYFHEFSFKVNGIQYPFSQISDIRDYEQGKLVVGRNIDVYLTKERYELVRPGLLACGIGKDERLTPNLNLR